jgi:hypothetical protein
MIQVNVAGLSLSNVGFVVLLRGEQDPRALAIFIGGAEAQSILVHLEQVEIPRPLTHDLLKTVLDCMECRLKRVVISDLIESTFYAVLVVDRDGVEAEIDARPSDAVSLALRCSAPIYVVKKVMDQAGIILEDKDAESAPEGLDGEGAPLKQLKTQLEKAIHQERYEDAARLRDEIKKWEQGHGKN